MSTDTIRHRQPELDAVLAEMFPPKKSEPVTTTSSPLMSDEEVLRHVREAKNAAKFFRLWAGDISGYGSPSEADQALCSLLAFWTQDRAQLDALFRRSALYREDKWERDSYREPTLDRALDGGEAYSSPVPIDLEADGDDLPALPIMRLPEYISNVPEEPEWFLRLLIAPGVSTLGFAPYKCGKSSLVWGFLRAVERRDTEFLSHAIRAGFKTLFMTEEGGFTIRDKYFDLDLEGENIDILSSRDRGVAGIPWPTLWRAVLRDCERSGYRLIILDTVSTWCGLGGETENQAGAVTEAVRPFKEACEEAGVALVLLHHARKEGGSHGKAIRGSTAFLALVDSYFELSYLGPDKNSPRKLAITSRFIDDSEPVAYTYMDGEFEWTADIESATETKSGRRADVLEAVQFGARTADDVATSVGISVYTARKHLNALMKRGSIIRTGRGSGDSPYEFKVSE